MTDSKIDRTNYSWSWTQFFWALSIIVVLPNSVMLLFAWGFSLERPYINVDYSVVMLLLLVNQRILSVVALVAVFLFDVLALVGQIFPVLRLSDVPYMAKFIGVAPFEYKVAGAALFLILFAFVFAFLFNQKRRSKLEFLVCINLIVLVYGVSAIFGSEKASQVWHSKDRALISSQVIFGIDSRRTGFVGSLYAKGPLFGDVSLPGATKPWFESFPDLEEKLLLIVNESWGVSSPEIQAAVISPLLESANKMSDWKQGTMVFNGITVEGEMRELCQADLLHFNFEGHQKDLSGCIPNMLKELGYKTFAFHGAAGLMYDRVKWYPDVGFGNMTFLESYPWASRCYSFPGACDTDMADRVIDTYGSDGKVFGYWLTLNTHHSYDLRDLSSEVLRCSDIGVDSSSEVCRNLKLQNQFFNSVAKIISNPNMSGTRVVIVSDHEPRISNQDHFRKYFEAGRIPWVSFKIR